MRFLDDPESFLVRNVSVEEESTLFTTSRYDFLVSQLLL